MTDLRSYQGVIIAQCNQVIANGQRRPLIVAPTGAGKTVIAAAIIKTAVADQRRVLVLGHTREIIKQTSLKLSGYQVEHGIIQADLVGNSNQSVQVASIQTLWSRAMRTDRMALPAADLLIIDEAHHCPANTYRQIIKSYPNAVLIGLSATPCRGDGRGLGGIFDSIIECPQVAELVAQKYLVKTRHYAPADPDLKGVEVRTGDYVEVQLAECMDRSDLVGDIVSHWHRYGERCKTVCFAVNVPHSLHIRDEFLKSGVRAAHLDGSMPKPQRDAVLAQLAAGEIDVVTNCMVLTEGWDMPDVGCCILARPTRKMGLYRQMVGRVLRPASNKYDAIVLDHSGAVFRHGFIEDPVTWTLDPDKRAISQTHNARLRSGYSSRLLECTKCGAIRVAGEPCRACGFLPQRPPQSIVFRDGDLAAVDRHHRTAKAVVNPDVRIRWHAMLMHIATVRGYKVGWAAHKYREKFGIWPAARFVTPIEPSAEVLSWVRSRNIAHAKARAKGAAA
jgi:DNA repair protein RadD